MSSYHVYLLQCNFHRIETALNELKDICQTSDVIVLMEDAVFALHHPLIHTFSHIKVLRNTYHSDELSLQSDHLQFIHYNELADLIHHSAKTHCWR